MKTILAIILLLLSPVLLLSQERNKEPLKIGLQTHVSVFSYTYRGYLIPNVEINAGKGRLSIGPTILIATNIGSVLSKGPKLTGFNLTYKYFPNPTADKFSLFFNGELQAQRITEKWKANALDINTGDYVEFGYQITEYILEYSLGYGFSYWLTPDFFLLQGVGAGVYYSILMEDERGSGSSKAENFDYRGYHDVGFAWSVKFGMGFKL